MQARMVYGRGARGFHWLTVALLLIIMPMGIVMGDLPRGPLQNTLFITHESLGITVLALVVQRAKIAGLGCTPNLAEAKAPAFA